MIGSASRAWGTLTEAESETVVGGGGAAGEGAVRLEGNHRAGSTPRGELQSEP